MKQAQTIIIGGGAAGLMAAITAARRKQRVLIIERNKQLGRKILATGNGRCNLTNLHISPDKYYGSNTKGLYNIFSRFSARQAMDFFEELGVHLKTEEAGRVFPVTNQAGTVVDLLTEEIARLDITVQLMERVTDLKPQSGHWAVTTHKDTYEAPKVILSTGGASYPQLGSTGDGFELAQKLGHRIISPRPAIVPLEIGGNPPECPYGRAGWFHKLQGVKCDVELILHSAGKVIMRQSGELMFTHYGISGPVVLDLSRVIMDYQGKPETTVALNFFPGYHQESLARFLTERWQTQPQKTVANSLMGLLPKKLCYVLLGELKLPAELRVNEISKAKLTFLSEQLTRWVITVLKTRPFTESMVTAGGVPLDEVNTRTMESLKAPGLYLAGEVLDIDGVSGGYNLQFAWSTGYLAGQSS